MGTSKAGKVCVCAIQSISQEELKVLIFGLILHLSLTEKKCALSACRFWVSAESDEDIYIKI